MYLYDRNQLKSTAHSVIQPMVNVLVKAHISADFFTILGLALNLVACLVLIIGAVYGSANALYYVGWGGFFILMGGVCDVFDGQIARTSGQASSFGALFDSVLDRYSELLMFFGLGFFFAKHGFVYVSVALFFALMGSLMVSYVRARAEGLQIECAVGLMQRPERIVLLGIGALLCGLITWTSKYEYVITDFSLPIFHPVYFVIAPIFLVAVLANITALRRLHHCYQVTQQKQAK